MSERSLAIQAGELFAGGRNDDVLDRATAAWDAVRAQPVLPRDRFEGADIGEALRIAALAARQLGDDRWRVWLARARACFAACGSASGTAMTMLVDLYEVVTRWGADAMALDVLEAVERCAEASDEGARREYVLAIVWEKRGFVLLEMASRDADAATLAAARTAYERALGFASGDARRRVKAPAAIVTVDLLAGAIDAEEAIRRLGSLRADAVAAGALLADVVGMIDANVARLRDGVRPLEPYDRW
jgi:hypothetical protein